MESGPTKSWAQKIPQPALFFSEKDIRLNFYLLYSTYHNWISWVDHLFHEKFNKFDRISTYFSTPSKKFFFISRRSKNLGWEVLMYLSSIYLVGIWIWFDCTLNTYWNEARYLIKIHSTWFWWLSTMSSIQGKKFQQQNICQAEPYHELM